MTKVIQYDKKNEQDLWFGISPDGVAYIDQWEADFFNSMHEAWWPVPIQNQTVKTNHIQNIKQAAKNHLKKKTISIRMLLRDISKAKSISMRKGISYQTYLTMIIHKAIEQDYYKEADDIIL